MNDEHVVDTFQLSGFLQDVSVMETTFWVIPIFVATDGKMAF
jgi:hypothetical protein